MTDHRPSADASAGKTALALVGLLVFAAVAGCRAKGEWSENDDLRSRIIELEGRLADTTRERDEARAKLAEAERVRLTGGELAADAADALPRCAGIEIDRFSGVSGLDRLDVYVRPIDGRGRFVQIVGTVNIRADVLPAPGSAPDVQPRRIASTTVAPAELREAYRSTVLGTHYTIALAVDPAGITSGDRVALSVEFLDALTGQAFRAERIVPAGMGP